MKKRTNLKDRFCIVCDGEAIIFVDNGWIWGWCADCEEMWQLRKRKGELKKRIVKRPWQKWRVQTK